MHVRGKIKTRRQQGASCKTRMWWGGVATDTKSIRLNLSLFVRFISYSATHCYTDDNMIHFPKRDDKSYNNRRFFRTVPNGQHMSWLHALQKFPPPKQRLTPAVTPPGHPVHPVHPPPATIKSWHLSLWKAGEDDEPQIPQLSVPWITAGHALVKS